MRFPTVRTAIWSLFALGWNCAAPGAQDLAARQETKTTLNLVVVEGEGSINNIRLRTAKDPVVRVEDELRRPVAGASVTFIVPDLGAGGGFADHGATLTAVTDANGLATGRGLRPNGIAGPFQIRVAASFKGRRGSAVINQTNVAPVAGHSSARKKLAIVGLVAGAAVGTGVALMGRGKAGSTAAAGPAPAAGTVISPGSPVFGPPR